MFVPKKERKKHPKHRILPFVTLCRKSGTYTARAVFQKAPPAPQPVGSADSEKSDVKNRAADCRDNNAAGQTSLYFSFVIEAKC